MVLNSMIHAQVLGLNFAFIKILINGILFSIFKNNRIDKLFILLFKKRPYDAIIFFK